MSDHLVNWPEQIRSAFESNTVLYTGHARREMREERLGPISDQEIAEAMINCEVIETYPDDQPYASVLALGRTRAGRPLHAVCAHAPDSRVIIVVTVYEPDPVRWDAAFRRRP